MKGRVGDEMSDVIGKWLALIGGFTRACVIADGNIAQKERLFLCVWIGFRTLGGAAIVFGGEVLVGPAEHIGGRRLGAELCVERGDACIITAE